MSHSDALFGSTAGAAGEPPRPAPEPGRHLDAILRIPVSVQVVLGSTTMPVANLMKLGRGAVIPLDHRIGEPVDVVVNGRVVARGEVVVVEEDNSRFGVSLTEIVGQSGSDGGA
ncbi:flagellar motor switch protein FliN [Propylenella binzhouense]|uniref:Flagellar motor switch protein FliN n=1 Tax=Propylenella binzhouense TaxID=2555902 RepID=A0A964WSL0_9HYPH|nr:flagellar motor switch protein FliN [Propylenella binzhouense]MYZ46986.1 flagellar motor switch protein FliN [Propylenella binzhouense]